MNEYLTINSGSSSIKFAIFNGSYLPNRGLYGYIDRIGLPGTTITCTDPDTHQMSRIAVKASSRSSVVNFLIDWLEKQPIFDRIKAVGHRIVQGMDHQEPEYVTEELMKELRRIRAYDPDHLPSEIELIETFQKRHPHLLQVACFDTAFHRSMPRVAQRLPIPRRFDNKGVRRYGFRFIVCVFARRTRPSGRTEKLLKVVLFWRIWVVGRVCRPFRMAEVLIRVWALRPPAVCQWAPDPEVLDTVKANYKHLSEVL